MNPTERFHADRIAELSQQSAWPELVRYFVAQRGYQPAMNAAISVLIRESTSAAALPCSKAQLAQLLTRWDKPDAYRLVQDFIPRLSRQHEQHAVIMFCAFQAARSIRQLSQNARTEGALESCSRMLKAISLGCELAENGGDLAVAAALKSDHGTALEVLGLSEDSIHTTQEAIDFYRALDRFNSHAHRSHLASELTSISLRLRGIGRSDLALLPAQEAIDLYRGLALSEPKSFRPGLATAVSNIAVFFSDLGRLSEAADAAQEAVELRRSLAKMEPEVFGHALAGSLTNLAVMLGFLGRKDEALRFAYEAADVFRTLARLKPSAFGRGFGGALTNLAVTLADVGRSIEAIQAAQEAVDLFRKLDKSDPREYRKDLAGSLNNLANALADSGHFESAVQSSRESVDTFRILAQMNPAFFLGSLANSLTTLGHCLCKMRNPADALETTEEAVNILRSLSSSNPTATQLQLANAVNLLARCSHEVGRFLEAVELNFEAVGLFRILVNSNPAAFSHELARALCNAAISLNLSGRHSEAMAAAREAVDLFRVSDKIRPGSCSGDLARSLDCLACILGDLRCSSEAIEAAREATCLYRTLAGRQPDSFAGPLAQAISNQANRCRDLGLLHDALMLAQEAVEMGRALVENHPGVFDNILAMSLHNLAIILSDNGRSQSALEAAREASASFQRLSQRSPGTFTSQYAKALTSLANRLRDLGQWEESLKPALEASCALRSLRVSHFDAFEPDLALCLNNLGAILLDLGRADEAVTELQEAVEIRRALAELNPAVHDANLAGSLSNLAACYYGLGHTEDALGLARDAIDVVRGLAESHPSVYTGTLIKSLSNCASYFIKQNRFGDALPLLMEGLDRCRVWKNECPDLVLAQFGVLQSTVAVALNELGDSVGAMTSAIESIDSYQRISGNRLSAFANEQANAYLNLALILLTPTNPKQDSFKAMTALRGAVKCIERHRGSYRGEAHRRRVVADAVSIYELLVRVAVDLWEVSGDPSPLHDALCAAEAIRQRQLLDRFRSEVLEPDVEEPMRREWRRCFELLEAVERALSNVDTRAFGGHELGETRLEQYKTADFQDSVSLHPSASEAQEESRYELLAQRQELEKQHELILEQVRRIQPDFDPYQPLPQADFDEVKHLLESRPGTVLVEYVVTSVSGFVLLVHGGQAHAIRLGKVNTQWVQSIAMWWREGYPETSESDVRRLEALRKWGDCLEYRLTELAREILWPVLMGLSEWEARCGFKASSLIICPHKHLNVFPFHAMPLSEGSDERLMDCYAVSYIPSVSMLGYCSRRNPSNGQSFLFGNPTEDLWFMGVAAEVYRGSNPDAKVIHGMGATVEVLLHGAGSMGMVSISAHMRARKDPMASAIELGEGAILELSQIYRHLRLRLHPNVELNGCASGLMTPVASSSLVRGCGNSGEVDGIDFDGLPMGFLFAGARCVISTLWTVYDLSAALLMHRYHQELRGQDADPVIAMQRASLWLRKGISNGAELQAAGEALLLLVPEDWAREHPRHMDYCRRVLAREAEEHPDDPPFASPIHWASHYVTGWCWDPVEFSEKR